VVEALAPDGRVRVRGELWRARVRSDAGDDAEALVRGTTVRIEEIEGLRLIVSADASRTAKR
jgi:membrane protein implicated in regulation of membrane protease activity